METKYQIIGMSCAACSARVEKAVSAVDGVEKCSVNLLTNSMIVGGNIEQSEIISAVEKAGYGISVADNVKNDNTDTDSKDDNNQIRQLKNTLAISAVFLIVLMYISMGHMMWNLPLPAFLAANPLSSSLVQMILSAIVLAVNRRFFVSGFRAIIRKSPNMDTLVSLGSGAAFIYSICIVFSMSDAAMNSDIQLLRKLAHNLYFESAAMIPALITVGKLLEAYSKGKTTNAIKSLMKLTPKRATVIRNGIEEEIDASNLVKGDIFAVKPGESFPADGIVTEGTSSADESALTGESIPQDKIPGSKVSAATINQYGYLKCRATQVGDETSLSKIIKLVSDAASGKAPIAKIADKVSGIFVPMVIIIAVITAVIWIAAGKSAGFALARGISVLVISCPCALGLATPVAIMVASGVGAKNGILFKTAESIEQAGKIDVCIFDKTGTITIGKPEVTDVKVLDKRDSIHLMKIAYSLEKMSEHPLSHAIVSHCEKAGISYETVTEFEIHPGNGLSAKLNGETIRGGNKEFICSFADIPDDVIIYCENLASRGKTPLYFATGNVLNGIIAVADTIKSDSKTAIEKIKKLGIKTVMLTGDNKKTAIAIANECGIDEVIAEVHPDGKEAAVREFQKNSKVAMIGDGINDAPALTSADVGFAIGAGVDIAIDAADAVIASSSLTDIASAVVLSRKTLKNIKENLFWAFFYNIIGIPLAAGVFINIFGWELNPMFGAAAMSLSSFCVVTNALRLNFVRLKNRDTNPETITEKSKNTEKENIKMEKVFNIEGMMCPHCEARVKKILEAIDGVESVVASHEKNNATIVLSKEVDDIVITNAIEAEGYKVV